MRRAWAAGVRNRVSARHRELLQQIIPIVSVPVEWIGRLGDNTDGQAVLNALCSLPDSEVLSAFADRDLVESTVISRVMAQESFSQNDIDLILKDESLCTLTPHDPKAATALLGLFADPAGSGAQEVAEPKRKRGRPRKGEVRQKEPTRLRKQLSIKSGKAFREFDSNCAWGCKKNSQSKVQAWKGYKLHQDVTDMGIPTAALVTGANVHDSQVSIPLEKITEKNLTHLYSVMDVSLRCATDSSLQ